jgi:hypothetical protein
MHSEIVLFPEDRHTGWYSIKRLKPEGPYEDISFAGGDTTFIPTEGPLKGTKTDGSAVWCAVLAEKLIIAPRLTAIHPSLFDGVPVKGYYCFDESTRTMKWTAFAERWDPNEIEEYRLLSNEAYRLYDLAVTNPKHLLLFGAGASYGSDAKWLVDKGELPPLGKDLFLACAKGQICGPGILFHNSLRTIFELDPSKTQWTYWMDMKMVGGGHLRGI